MDATLMLALACHPVPLASAATAGSANAMDISLRAVASDAKAMDISPREGGVPNAKAMHGSPRQNTSQCQGTCVGKMKGVGSVQQTRTNMDSVVGAEGAVFTSSVETPHVRAEPFKELRLESPTRSLFMEAPKGVDIHAEAGDIKATCRSDLRLQSVDGAIILDSRKIKLLRLPQGVPSSSPSRQTVFEVCVCTNGILFLSQAGTGSTCQMSNHVCI
ncbi:hypothetical protein ACEWY4_009512 [Coilia grayii]|uniref:Delta-sarcoglycan n=1 Tax=Coilia grayii TaxID=363190 RepID=A0ABD1K6Q2_9TELE